MVTSSRSQFTLEMMREGPATGARGMLRAVSQFPVRFTKFLSSPWGFAALGDGAGPGDTALEAPLLLTSPQTHLDSVCVCLGHRVAAVKEEPIAVLGTGSPSRTGIFYFFFAHLLFFFLSQFSHGQKLVANLADGRHATKSDANFYNVTESSSAR